MTVRNRVTEMLNVEYPIIQAPMGWIARAQLASAVSNAGGFGIIETSSGQFDAIRGEIARMRERTDKPWGVNIAQMFVRDPNEVVDFVAEQGVKFVTTSAGDPNKLTSKLKALGITVFHVVPSLRAALKAVDAGVDGLVVEGNEGGGFKASTGASTMVLLPLVASKVAVPLIAAGGICDGRSMAAAFALGAEGVQMGTQMVAAAESPVHSNWKELICELTEADTYLLNTQSAPAFRALKTPLSERVRHDGTVALAYGKPEDMYFGGDFEAMLALGGQVAGRIETIRTVKDIFDSTMVEFENVMRSMANVVT